MRPGAAHRIGRFSKAVLFTVFIHAALLALLTYSIDWNQPAKRGGALPIEAVAVADPAIAQAAAVEAAAEAKKLAALEKQRLAEARQRESLEKQRLAEEKRAAEKKRLAEQQRAVEEKRVAAEKRIAEQQARQAAAEELRQQIEAEQVKTQHDAGDALSALVDRISAAVERTWRRPPASRAGLVVLIRVTVAPDGQVLRAQVLTSSGDRFFDESAELAVRKASPLPFPTNPAYYEYINEFNFKFDPDET